MLFNLEGHGREACVQGVDVSRTVGWFTSMYSVSLKSASSEDLEALITGVKDQLRKMPDLHFYNDDSLEYIDGIERAVKGENDPLKDPDLLPNRKKL